MVEEIAARIGIYGAAFVVGAISSAIPVIPAEFVLAGYVAVAGNFWLAIILGLLVATGQMLIKIPMYQAARGATKLTHPAPDGKLAKAKRWIERWKDKPFLLTFVSATVGLPPFYFLVLVAGILDMKFRTFLAVGYLGRVVRFVGIALIAFYAPNAISW